MLLVVGIIVILLVGVGAFFAFNTPKQEAANTNTSTASQNTSTETADLNTSAVNSFTDLAQTWEFTGSAWQNMGTPPDCPSPLVLEPPTDLSKVTAILYPGQTRGGNYKAHGGFRLDNTKNDEVTIKAPIDAWLVKGSRYLEAGETQYMFDFISSCGIMYRLDHLRVLSSAFQAIANTFPEAKEDDSRTTSVEPQVLVKKGDVIATSVGFVKTSNTAFDWGVYDLRSPNKASQNASYAQTHSAEQAWYGVCWLDYLSSANSALVKSLPAGDSASGKTSDYCTN